MRQRFWYSSPFSIVLVRVCAMLAFLSPASVCIAARVEAPMTPPSMAIPLSVRPVAVDGHVEDAEWSDAAATTGFFALGTGRLADEQCLLFAKWNSEYLSLALRLPLPKDRAPKAQVIQRDGPVWDDDAVEIFLDPAHGHGDYFQFIANSKGVQWDSRKQEGSWSTEWQAGASVSADRWEAEFAIRFASLGRPTPTEGETWGFNAGWDRQTPAPLLASWSPLLQGFHDPGNFGHLVFSRTAPATRLLRVGVSQSTEVVAQGAVLRQQEASTPIVVARLSRSNTRQTEVVAEENLAPDPRTGAFRFATPMPRSGTFARPGEYLFDLTVSLAEGKALCAASHLAFEVTEPLRIIVRPFFLEGKLEADVSVAGIGRPPADITATASLWRPGGEKVMQQPIESFPQSAKTTVTFDVSKLPPGNYELRCEARWTKGELVVNNTVPITKPEKPEWLGSKEGISDKVLPPWTPIKADGTTVRPWGRSYEMKQRPFPQRIVTAGESLLTGPVRLVAKAAGEEREFLGGTTERVSKKPSRVELCHQSQAGPLQLKETVAVEYDGMARFDFDITATRPTTVESLALEIPLKPEHARYLYHFPGRWGSAYNAGALPKEGFASGFRPFIWLGDEDRGLAWFSESDRNWFSKEPNKVVQIIREAGRTLLRLTIIDTPTQVGNAKSQIANLSYTFGLQATPVKPVKEDVWDYRIVHAGNYGIEKAPSTSPASLTYPAKGNFDPNQGTLELWARPEFDPDPPIAADDPSRGQFNRSLFGITFPDGDWINLYWNIDDRGLRFFVKKGESYPILISSRQHWKKGELHHIALSWGEAISLFVDGKEVFSRPFKGTLERDVSGATVEFGGGLCEFALDEIRISDLLREPQDFNKELVVDDHTLLLDHLDETFQPDGTKQTRAAKIAEATRVTGGTPSQEASFGPVKFGKGILLYSPGPPKTQLDRLAEQGVRTIVFHEHWTDIQNYTSTTHGEQLRSLVKACHERGIRLLLYFGYEMSNIAPEWPVYSDECLVYPRAGGYKRLPEQTAYIVCYRSKWQDFMAHGMAKVMDEYDIDGVYLDGTEFPWGCANRHHGCGYERPDGTIGTTYPFFATRDMMRRIYTLVKTRKPYGQVNVHNSTCMTIMTNAWATSTWDGEQFGGIERGPNALDVLPLDAFRCEFTGRQWGVPAEFLCYNRPYTMHEALAFTLLHDVLVRGAPEEYKLWKAMEDFGRKKAKFLPYWNNADFVTTNPENVKASIYSRGSLGAMLVVSNLGKEKQEATATLNLKLLGLNSKAQGADALSGVKLSLTKGVLSLDLEPMDWKLVWVR